MTQQDVTYQDKLDELRLDVSHPNSQGRVFVLLEGESDIQLFRKLFNSDHCKVENIPGGNSKVEDAVLDILPIYPLIIGIRDADFIRLNNITYSKTNMFLTDYHDIEMTLVAELSVFSAILSEFTDIEINRHETIREEIMRLIEPISLIKWLNDTEKLEISFKKPSFQDLLNFSNWQIDFNEYFTRLISKSPNATITDFSTIVNKLQTLKTRQPNMLQLCNGHDFMKAIAAFLREKSNKKFVNEEYIASIFRIKYSKDDFYKTDLYSSIKHWGNDHNVNIFL